METKLFEVRDKMTFIPTIAVKLDRSKTTLPEDYLVGRAGYDKSTVVLFGKLDGKSPLYYDPTLHPGTETMKHAHHHLQDNWDDLESGDVIDIEYLHGRSQAPKKSARLGF